jgi:hypothetical protein
LSSYKYYNPYIFYKVYRNRLLDEDSAAAKLPTAMIKIAPAASPAA